jgi:hypothetical protein
MEKEVLNKEDLETILGERVAQSKRAVIKT